MKDKPTIIIRQATIDDSDRLTYFRILEYKSSKEFELLNIAPLRQQYGFVYIAEYEGRIISTMQAEVLGTKDELELKCIEIIPTYFLDYPTVYLSKAATDEEFRTTGLNSYIRLLFLRMYVDNFNIQSFTGAAYENAPRLQLLSRLGYVFTEILDRVKDDYIRPFGKVYFLSLCRNQFELAINTLEMDTSQLTQNFNIEVK